MRYLSIVILIGLFSFGQKAERDPRLIGQWITLYSTNGTGEIQRDMLFGKNYVETFTKSGKYILDPQFLRDDMKSRGINEPLDYASIPTFSWKTENNEVLIIDSGQGSQKIRYGFSGDTLLKGYPNGHIRYLLKRK
ncbi:hypothetical protein [Algoriphagus hitonicola]|uniref:Lipocalin-like domain-containing protein n=1 Tax=Algoriphagus hitonicola TaxID=435880 RepID=A0A1I2WBV4_9BACT|nr:hypothetical protein [Algoriphagus hitonicola]SFG98853.1 hypothetical protein SAMN04487988_11258 [Algoriphagus hitonicola]